MAKKFRLSKSFSRGLRIVPVVCLKAAKGKSVAGSLDIDFPMGRQLLLWHAERDIVLDDLGPEDFEADWVWPSRLARSRAAAEAKIIWILRVWSSLTILVGVLSNLQNFHVGESSRSATAMDTCETDGISCLRVVPNDPCVVVSSGFAAMDSKRLAVTFVLASWGPLIGVRSSKNLASI